MSEYVTISIKIRRDVMEKLKNRGIKISDVLRRAIEKELRRIGLSEIEAEVEELRGLLSEFDTEFIVRSIRGSRNSR
ncbi:MAG: hypothetical protein QXQ57_03245 [Sulfolobales archaeon]